MNSLVQNPADQPLRANFSFSVEGLAPRDELLFKSLLRLLNHRTEHGWFYTPDRSAEQVDLRVVSDRIATTIAPLPAPLYQAILTLSVVERHQPGFLMLPIRSDVLELELNRLGHLIEKTRTALAMAAAIRPTPAAESAAALPVEAPYAARPTPSIGDRPFKLSRWPSQHLINTPARLRIATLMVGRPITLLELAHKTGRPLPECIEFVNDLWRANLVTDGGAAAVAAPAREVGGTVPAGSTAVAVKAPVPIQRGLLARIRSRLGL